MNNFIKNIFNVYFDQHFDNVRKYEGVQKFALEKWSYIFVLNMHNFAVETMDYDIVNVKTGKFESTKKSLMY
jgi:hypothetical protein